ncbi:hypothetical protein [Embleya scabrispora]|uniref:hypothetical protein n=1 Tax=Embleya scabrispora TaxID=159449 RepID=UPI0003A33BC8|nr:hypothetical protein [Embleya scabrispora]MYS80287.1 hypothetical protein [Streptomyces sp. SID5474]
MKTSERTISFGSEHAEPDYLCSPADEQRSAQQVRRLFDRNHTLVAGIVPGPPGRGRRAAAFDLTTGRAVGPPPADEFTSPRAPSESAPMFAPDTDTLWYQDADKRVLSRAPRSPAAPRERGRSSANAFLLSGESVWSPAATVEMVSPGGDVAVAYEYRRGMRLVRNGQHINDAVRIGARDILDEERMPGDEKIPTHCSPRFWIDNASFVCADTGALIRVTLAPDRASVVPLLPANDRTNTDAFGSRPRAARTARAPSTPSAGCSSSPAPPGSFVATRAC